MTDNHQHQLDEWEEDDVQTARDLISLAEDSNDPNKAEQATAYYKRLPQHLIDALGSDYYTRAVILEARNPLHRTTAQ